MGEGARRRREERPLRIPDQCTCRSKTRTLMQNYIIHAIYCYSPASVIDRISAIPLHRMLALHGIYISAL